MTERKKMEHELVETYSHDAVKAIVVASKFVVAPAILKRIKTLDSRVSELVLEISKYDPAAAKREWLKALEASAKSFLDGQAGAHAPTRAAITEQFASRVKTLKLASTTLGGECSKLVSVELHRIADVVEQFATEAHANSGLLRLTIKDTGDLERKLSAQARYVRHSADNQQPGYAFNGTRILQSFGITV